ncbi:hypothetical protein WJX73_002946 [Symbiochloris irregularis]|uniref:SKI-interacting protein SKIP SNW domain-containing protein n=1 Tax=Symbiochloris irregularis TaxID=706552 RepID=A0AAW1PZ61_9CHLO
MLLAHLPAPTREYTAAEHNVKDLPAANKSLQLTSAAQKAAVPPYGSYERALYRPRRQDDYGDGGAFPEIPMPQFPLDMGRKDGAASSKTLGVTLGNDGNIKYDAILRQGQNKDKIIASEHSALVPKIDREVAERPDEDEVAKATRETRAALDRLVEGKISAAQPKTLPAGPGAPEYIKYTPSQQGPQYNSGAGQRIIRMQDMPVDPMEPPKFRHKKVPRGAGSPPVPVMHSPPRAVTAKEQQDWKVPPCISNWKNPKGYTIPLDKRLAADGRGLQEGAISDNFAKFTESLFVAEQHARQAVEMRTKVQQEMAAREKAKKDAELRNLAIRARMDRMGNPGTSAADRDAGTVPSHAGVDLPGPPDEGYPLPPPPAGGRGASKESREERAERSRRDEIREDRRRERDRERRLDERDRHGVKKSKLTRDADRDISEKIALGQANVRASGEAMYDQRLFNQDAGVASGLAADDSYNTYDKALFADRSAVNKYRPTRGADEDDDEAAGRTFKPDKGFAGADYTAAGRAAAPPTQFERDPAAEADDFGLDKLLGDMKAGSRKDKRGALDHIGGGGRMAASGGGGSYEDYAHGSSRSKVEFSRGRN